MKRYSAYLAFVTFLLTVVLTGCRREPLPETGDAIRFSVSPATVEVDTKADALSVKGDLVKVDNKVALFGSYSTGTSTSVLFNGTTLTCTAVSGDNATWSYEYEGSPLRYWVREADSHDFRAVFPALATVTSGSSSSVAVTYDATNGYDLMVASEAGATPNTPVELKFRHACAAVRFEFKKSGNDTGETCTITSAKLTKVATSGTLTYVGASADTQVLLSEWSSVAPTSETEWALSDWTNRTVSTDYSGPWYYAVPQALDGTELVYSYDFAGDTDTVTLSIPNITWSPAMTYVYTIDIGMSRLDVQIEPWDSYSVWVTDIPFPDK